MSVISRIRAFFGTLTTHKMAPWFWFSAALLGIIAVLAPQQLPVSLYKLSLITSAAWLAYWIDRALFPYGRPDDFLKPWLLPPIATEPPPELPLTKEQVLAFVGCMLRRAIIIGAAMLAVALGA